ncbi:MAG: hypothetical protein Tsb0015_08080 [Simkaniaceae bacterium]
MKKCLFLLVLIFNCHIFASAPKGFFANYPNYYFVESGSFTGEGINNALKSGKFKEIHSIELSDKFFSQCKNLFRSYSQVHLWHGDSGDILGKVIKNLNKPITFWLDGHYSGGETAKGKNYSPIIRELEHIQKHPIKNHTILIDDVRLMGTKSFDNVTLEMIIEKIYEINPYYEISFQRGYVDNDILVAEIK